MNNLTRSFLCMGLLVTTFSAESAYKTTKILCAGLGFTATGCAAHLIINYVQFPHPQLAKSAVSQNLSAAKTIACKYLAPAVTTTINDLAAHINLTTAQTIDAGSTTLLESPLLKKSAKVLHLSLYPKKENCPSIAKFDICPAHNVDFVEGLVINAIKAAKSQTK